MPMQLKIGQSTPPHNAIRQAQKAEYHFKDLEKILEIYVHLTEDRCHHNKNEAKAFRKECEAFEGGYHE